MRKHLAIAAFAIAAIASQPAQARHHHHHPHAWRAGPSHALQARGGHHPSRHAGKAHQRLAKGETVGHPPGCPWRLFCGCGASVEIFGHPVRDLFLASNWRRFPPAAPAPGMAAWRSGHVFIIREVYGDGTVLAYDPNSGGHQTRLHRRSLAGFHVVNPHAGRAA